MTGQLPRIPWPVYDVRIRPGQRWAGLSVQAWFEGNSRSYLLPYGNRVPLRAWGDPWRMFWVRRRLRRVRQW